MIFLKGLLMAMWVWCAWLSFWNNLWETATKQIPDTKLQDKLIVIEVVGAVCFAIWFYLK
jgi:hypothetical protein